MSDHNLYINDLIHRNSGYSFSESTTGSIITVTFKDGSSNTVAEQTGLTLIDAYRKIRFDVLNGEVPAFLSTTTQKDALTNVDLGTVIHDINTGNLQFYNSSSAWISSAGDGMMSAAAYGHMYENNSTGSAMDTTNKTWITATTGVVDSSGIVTFVNDSTGDHFLIGTDGAGDYVVHVDTKQTNSGNNTTTLTVQIDGVDTIIVRDEVDTSSTKPAALDANGILSLVATNKVRLHMVSSVPANIVTSYYTHFYIHRLS